MKPAGKPADRIFNLLTVLVLGLTAISCLCIGTVFLNPAGVFTFLGPATFPAPLTVPTLGSSYVTLTPLVYPTLPPEWTATITSTPTDELATSTPTHDSAAPTNGTRTPFPSPVGPTATLTPTDPPTLTAKVPTPTRTATHGPYPGEIPTKTPIPPTSYP